MRATDVSRAESRALDISGASDKSLEVLLDTFGNVK